MQLLDTVGVNNLSEYIDSGVGANYQAWSYYIALLDSCDNEYGSSFTSHTTIWLSGSQPNANQVALSWTPYLGATPSRYVIYRRDNPTANYAKLDSVPVQVTGYIDSALPAGNGFSYKIGAVMDSGCVASFKTNAESISNIFEYASIGQDEDMLQNKLAIFPNPTTGPLQLTIPVAGEFTLFSVNGQLIKSGKVQGQTIDLSQIPAGLYVLEIKPEATETVYFKVQKQ